MELAFMEMPCVELCPDCPLRDMLPDGAEFPDKPRHLEQVGERTLPATYSYSGSDGSMGVGIEYGAGPRQTEVAILSEGVKTGPAFWAREGTWSSGAVQRAFEDCDEPTQIRYGFLKLSKQAVCEAMRSLK